MTTASIHLLDTNKTATRHRLSDDKTAFRHLLSVAKVAISATVAHPRQGGGQIGPVNNGSVALPETMLPQTPYGFPVLQKAGP